MSVVVAGASSAQRRSVARNAPNACTKWSYCRRCVCSAEFHGPIDALYSTSSPTATKPPARCAVASTASAITNGPGSGRRRTRNTSVPTIATDRRYPVVLLA